MGQTAIDICPGLQDKQCSQSGSHNRLLRRVDSPQMAHQTGTMDGRKLVEAQCRYDLEIAGVKLGPGRIQNEVGREKLRRNDR